MLLPSRQPNRANYPIHGMRREGLVPEYAVGGKLRRALVRFAHEDAGRKRGERASLADEGRATVRERRDRTERGLLSHWLRE